VSQAADHCGGGIRPRVLDDGLFGSGTDSPTPLPLLVAVENSPPGFGAFF
jgi:hypothetical protein